MEQNEFNEVLGKLIARAWSDDNFKQRLLEDTMGVFREYNIDFPENIEFQFVENPNLANKVVHLLYLPTPPRTYDESFSNQYPYQDSEMDYNENMPDDDYDGRNEGDDPCPWDDWDGCDGPTPGFEDHDYMSEDGPSDSPCYHGDDFS